MRPVVIVMIKAPRAGVAKTRLTPLLSATEAATLAAAFAQDTVNNALRVLPDALIAYTPSDGRALLASLLPEGLRWLEQRGADLGARLEAAIAHAAALDYGPL